MGQEPFTSIDLDWLEVSNEHVLTIWKVDLFSTDAILVAQIPLVEQQTLTARCSRRLSAWGHRQAITLLATEEGRPEVEPHYPDSWRIGDKSVELLCADGQNDKLAYPSRLPAACSLDKNQPLLEAANFLTCTSTEPPT